MLDFVSLAANGIPTMGIPVCAYYAEAAAVAFHCAGHGQGVQLSVLGHHVADYPMNWIAPDDGTMADWPDIRETVENGACAVAILLVPLILPYHEVRRSYQGTGFDFWMSDEPTLGFQEKAGLEVSGMARGNANQRRSRLNKKLAQAKSKVRDGKPTYAIVVEFSSPLAECVQND